MELTYSIIQNQRINIEKVIDFYKSCLHGEHICNAKLRLKKPLQIPCTINLVQRRSDPKRS